MGYKEFSLDTVTGETREVELPESAPAPAVSQARQTLVSGGSAEVQGSTGTMTIQPEDYHRAKRELVEAVLDMYCSDLAFEDLTGQAFNELAEHYWQTDVAGKKSNRSGNGDGS